jgi:hypothetical protein
MGTRRAVAVTILSLFVGATVAAGPATPGTKLWAARYNDPANDSDVAQALAVSPDGTQVFVGGSAVGPTGNEDYATVAYDATTGARVWSTRYNGPGDNVDAVHAVAVSPDGSLVFVTGVVRMTTEDYGTVAYDASSGAQVWATNYDSPRGADDVANDLAVSHDGSTVYVTGSSNSGRRMGTVAYDAETGTRQWVASYPGSDHNGAGAVALGVSADGTRVVVTGYVLGPTGKGNYATVAYDASDGSQTWVRLYNGPVNHEDAAQALALSPDGSAVFVTGRSAGRSSMYDFATIAYAVATGAPLWMKRYNGPSDGADGANAIGVSPDGMTVFATGFSAGPSGNSDYATIAYDATSGGIDWTARYRTPMGGADATAMGVSPDGTTVFVTGTSTGPVHSSDFATIAYSSYTGALLWVSRYGGSGTTTSVPTAVGLSPDGSRVFVTGDSSSRKTSSDFATVAYSAI